jgi:hypothetical protein
MKTVWGNDAMRLDFIITGVNGANGRSAQFLGTAHKQSAILNLEMN